MLDAFIMKRLRTPLSHGETIGISRYHRNSTHSNWCLFWFLAVIAITLDALAVAVLCFCLNRLLDGLDGALARIQGPTERGAFFDITCDFLIYSAIPLGFAIPGPERRSGGHFPSI